MTRAATKKVAARASANVLVLLVAGIMPVYGQSAVAPPEAPAALNAVDFNFVGQANLGAPFQVDSGRIAERKGTSAAIRSYAHLMVTTHIPVIDALNVILRNKNITPSNTLLHGAYNEMLAELKADRGAAFDRAYVNGQVEYQKGNAALFEQEIENGNDPDLKEFAQKTLPKIVDHLQRAVKLAGAAERSASN
ncbi:MAG: putative rane protein [Methylobacteriaceae bacterium]|nr:putative rane protein [Methylobacteriaceae bacterium]